MLNKKHKLLKMRSGFTLVEFLIVIAIIGIMTAVTIAFSQREKTDTEVDISAREVAAAVREAQNNALAGKGASSTCNQYAFSFGGTAYSISGSGCPSSSFTLKNGVTFTSTGNITFSIPFGTVGGATGIKVTKNSVCYCISVSPSGLIEEKGKLANCSDSC